MAAAEELAVPESSLGLRVMVRPLRRSALDRSAKTLFLHALRKKKAGILGFPVNSGLYRTCLELQMVEVAGIEPASEGTPSPALHA